MTDQKDEPLISNDTDAEEDATSKGEKPNVIPLMDDRFAVPCSGRSNGNNAYASVSNRPSSWNNEPYNS